MLTECGSQRPVSFRAENVPFAQGVHDESVDEEPALNPEPAAQVSTVWGRHASPATENDPLTHAPSHTASRLAVPAVNGVPLAQVGVEWVIHAVLSLPAE